MTVEVDGSTDIYTLVGSAEADPGAGRLSVASPVGRALLGATAGTDVAVKTPRGAVTYRVVREKMGSDPGIVDASINERPPHY